MEQQPQRQPYTLTQLAQGWWRWSDGSQYERCPRSAKQPLDAYSSALHHDEDSWHMMMNLDGFRSGNKREDLDSKLSNRQMVQQIGYNPFLQSQNYVDHLSVQDQFLKPVNTTLLE